MKPVLQALIVAEHIYHDVSGKKVIAGTFNSIILAEVPVEVVEDSSGKKHALVAGGMHAGSPYVYISLTDVCNDTDLHLQFVNLSKNEAIFETAIKVESKDRLQTVEVVAPLPPLTFSGVGLYAFEVLCEGEILGSHRIHVSKYDPD